MREGEKTWLCDVPCRRGHFRRYVDNVGCVDCNHVNIRKYRDADDAEDADTDHTPTNVQLIRANLKFLKLLHAEALNSIRAAQ